MYILDFLSEDRNFKFDIYVDHSKSELLSSDELDFIIASICTG